MRESWQGQTEEKREDPGTVTADSLRKSRDVQYGKVPKS